MRHEHASNAVTSLSRLIAEELLAKESLESSEIADLIARSQAFGSSAPVDQI